MEQHFAKYVVVYDFDEGLDKSEVQQVLKELWPTLHGEAKQFEESDLTSFFETYNKNERGRLEKSEIVRFVFNFSKPYLAGGGSASKMVPLSDGKSPFF